MLTTNPIVINGGRHEDNRGKLIYFNLLDIKSVKRFYSIHIFDTETIRAWQGHKKESKWFYVTAGTFKIVLVKIDDWINPSGNLNTKEFILNINDDKVLIVPGGFATGLKALEKESKLMVFSDFTLEESLNDNFRFDKNLWHI